MKRIFILLATLLSIGFDAQSQTTRKFALELAPTIGLNRAKLYSGDGDPLEAGRSALSIGVKAFSSTNTAVFFQTGAFINGKGYYENYGGGDYLRLKTTYIEVPINVGYRLPLTQQLSATVFGGPYAAFAITGKYEEKDDGDYDSFSIFDSEESDGFKRLDGGINIGASVEINKSMLLSLQQSFGILNLTDDKNFKVTNRVFNVSLSYILK